MHIRFNDYGAHHHFGSIKRWRFYLACSLEGEAQLLCRGCHSRVTTVERASQLSKKKRKLLVQHIDFPGVLVLPVDSFRSFDS